MRTPIHKKDGVYVMAVNVEKGGDRSVGEMTQDDSVSRRLGPDLI